MEARTPSADLLIVNKFGKPEAQGRGPCPAISIAMEIGIPTLVGVNEMNAPVFLEFSADMALPLAQELRAVRVWFENVRRSCAVAAV